MKDGNSFLNREKNRWILYLSDEKRKKKESNKCSNNIPLSMHLDRHFTGGEKIG